MSGSAPIVALTTSTADAGSNKPRVRVNRAYADALSRAGLIPVLVPSLAPAEAEQLIARVDGLVLTGGDDVDPGRYGQQAHPRTDPPDAERDASELALLRAARAARLPTLAICRGVQLVNVATGGTLIQDIGDQRPAALVHNREDARAARVHGVSVQPATRLADALGAQAILVNSLHHQALDRLGDGLRLAGHADDGIVEAVEWDDDSWWMVGVQWHPEELDRTPEPWDRLLFAAFAAVSASSASASRRGPGASGARAIERRETGAGR